MLYNEDNRNGRWYRGETVTENESKEWYPETETDTAPIGESEAEAFKASFRDSFEQVFGAPYDKLIDFLQTSSEEPSGTPDTEPEPQTAQAPYFTPAARSTAPRKEHKILRVLGIAAVCLLALLLAASRLIDSIGELRRDAQGMSGAFTADSIDDIFDFFDFDDFDDLDDYGEYYGDYDDSIEAPDAKSFFDSYYTSSSDIGLPRAPTGLGVTLPIRSEPSKTLSMEEIYRRVNPAVVGILCYADGAEYSWGTGVVFTADGYIITNAHVLQGADNAEILFSDESRYTAALIGSDTSTDIAVLKINAEKLPYAVFADSAQCVVGESVVAIGNPLGEDYSGTMTRGIISAIDRPMSNNGYTTTLIQTDAALNEGNSGGPLLNESGQVIGITSMKVMYSYTSTVEGIGFAIPTSVLKPVVDELLAKGAVSGKPALGIVAGSIPTEAQAKYKLPDGIYVSSVDERSDAWTQGLREGDVITAVEGIPVTTVAEVNAIKTGYAVGDILTVTVYRDGRTFDIGFALVDSSILEQ